ncbi:DUF2268 domain-containing protein [Oceanobacillus caeni]|uniref:Zn-dependent protease n=2 Tax=Bacillaceae TaxID=186817 RepID=A0ABR5MNJ6_9BACI|nr:DUF2268 domain-containing protein [Oceanobacillus caeni]KPH79158.1 Zn-dependent protease [Oceanobacillus caeni]MBU8792109.1 DUF2268 domain-containing protein [Oceanobacillus caeni]MCR1834682.1 DUF2268 domain-containing protein [Oceanobacillus caeni]MED4475651.1 DUF2268 domain-containing protein [Oceanobacillus caeni]
MSVIKTDKWLLDLYDKPIELCEKLLKHFDGAYADEIYNHLTSHGMYKYPIKNGEDLIRKLQDNKIWEIVHLEKQQLQTLWQGPDIPVFIFPSDPNDRKMKQNQNGKSGLAFKDKLFLFISKDNTEKEIRALFTHEYNHVCRLSRYSKKEEDYVLLDTIILEGLAENAVFERFGDKLLANWTTYYSEDQLEKLWKELILPNKNTLKVKRKHQEILYGLRRYPKMIGYCVGYYLVKKYKKTNELTSKELLGIKSNVIAQV